MAIEELWCRAGRHFYNRETTKGRKPIVCEEHQDLEIPKPPKKAKPTPPKPEIETLKCEAGHEWTRKPTRGRKPLWCPDHRPQPEKPAERRTRAPKPPQEEKPNPTLWCERGQHDWVRTTRKGRAPSSCPEHRVNISSTRPKIMSLDEIKRQYPNMDRESERILKYVLDEIDSPRWPGGRDQEDVKSLVRAFNIRLRYVARANKSPVAEVLGELPV